MRRERKKDVAYNKVDEMCTYGIGPWILGGGSSCSAFWRTIGPSTRARKVISMI